MSDINANIVINPVDLNVVVNPNELSFVPEAINLSIYTTGGGPASTLSANVANVHIYGGTNGYVLQTDGTGNLTWTAQTGNGGGSNGTPGGSNTQVQFNNAGNFGGNSGFTFDKVSGILTSPLYAGNANGLYNIVGANVSGYVGFASHADQADYATVANSVAGANVTGAVGLATYATTANSVAGANVTGAVGLATYATTANSVAGANVSGQVNWAVLANTVLLGTQSNITSVGTLTSLNVSGNTSISGTTSIYQAIENVAIIGAQTGTYNYDLLNGAIQYSTANATANLTLNFRGNSTVSMNSVLSTGQSTIGTLLMTTGASGYGVTAINIDSASQTINWAGNITPTIYANTLTSYTFTIIKTASSTYKVLGSGTRYG